MPIFNQTQFCPLLTNEEKKKLNDKNQDESFFEQNNNTMDTLLDRQKLLSKMLDDAIESITCPICIEPFS
eukprot:CAMPEP_0184858360 /NCGR_PEP_ID=MMETSP0580-20130426/3486_1 /TAXON_ID=1118495 /ORGANISM="Dactyliosolen fragilissimus" /LENGTH=69 /DNA_ID=CAMNT_0027354475 /DNA_START=8 /DNA_END=213 /DNA_ORIENTATION=+